MNLQSTLKGYVCQLKNRKSRNGRTVDDSSETLVPAVPLADEADALAAEALLDGEDISRLRLGRYFVVVGRRELRKMYNVGYDFTQDPKHKNASRPVDPQVCQSRGVLRYLLLSICSRLSIF